MAELSFALQFTDLIYHSRTLLNKKCMVYSSMENCERIQVQFWVLGPPHMHYYKGANLAMKYTHNLLKLPTCAASNGVCIVYRSRHTYRKALFHNSTHRQNCHQGYMTHFAEIVKVQILT